MLQVSWRFTGQLEIYKVLLRLHKGWFGDLNPLRIADVPWGEQSMEMLFE